MKPMLALLAAGAFALTTASAAPISLFDGRTFAGWEGDTNRTWRIENGAIVGGSLEVTVPRNEFLATTRRYTNFVLRFQVKLEGTDGFVNSGVQVRSERKPNHHEMIGYQADVGEGWWGAIYDETRRNTVLAKPDAEAVKKAVKTGDWNDYEVKAVDRRLVLTINGVPMVDYTESDPSIPQFGLIGLQIHGGGKGLVSFRNITIEELP